MLLLVKLPDHILDRWVLGGLIAWDGIWEIELPEFVFTKHYVVCLNSNITFTLNNYLAYS